MNKKKITTLLAIFMFFFISARADEGMWLLQLLKEQHSIELMKKAGLLLDADSIYSNSNLSLKDAVGIFGEGCTGEIISSEGLILTNHHCGFDAIQQHSSVEHDYLTNGFWTKNKSEELPDKNLRFRFVDKILNVTDSVEADIRSKKVSEIESLGSIYLTSLAEKCKKNSDYKDNKFIIAQVLPYYAGNSFYLIYYKVYKDIRLVAAPPQSIGKFGGETDNWMWPRHTGDFSMFRIYADKNGQPAEYSKDNVPLHVKKFLPISIKGIEDGDYAMIMGFPGRTSRYLTAGEIKMRMNSLNDPRIKVREARQNVLTKEMAASDRIRIMYASKFASSANYWKNSIGMNKAIIRNKVLETKEQQETRFLNFAKEKQDTAYANVITHIDKDVEDLQTFEYEYTCLTETFMRGIEFSEPRTLFQKLIEAKKQKNDSLITSVTKEIQDQYNDVHNEDYDHEVDRKVAKALLPLYPKLLGAKLCHPYHFFQIIEKKYKGDYSKYIDDLYDNSIFSNQANLDKFLKDPTEKALKKDPMQEFENDYYNRFLTLKDTMEAPSNDLKLRQKTYVRGLCEMDTSKPHYPDANFTIRLTYGNVKSYNPRDGVHYNYFTTLKGVIEKEDSTNSEFNVPAKLKELYEKKDFGQYAMKNGEMPVCFLSTNDITGGNSGSPVINANGELIGAAFDGNWESLSGDINFNNDLQRCICVDIRYILFLIDKFGNCPNLINEMKIVQ